MVEPMGSTKKMIADSCFGTSAMRTRHKSTSALGRPAKCGGKALPKDEIFSLSDFDI